MAVLNKTSDRMVWADVVRILAIYLVLQIHTIWAYPQWFINSFAHLAVISVPLFVMLSGALLLGKRESYKTFFTKRCLKVLVPWLLWTIIYFFYFYFFFYESLVAKFFTPQAQSVVISWIHFFIQVFLSTLWFLPVIFSQYLMTPFFRIFVHHAGWKDKFYLLGLWFLFVSVIPYTVQTQIFPYWEPTVIFTAIQYSGYFLLGYLFISKESSKVQPYSLVLLAIIGGVASFFSVGFLDWKGVIASLSFFALLFFFFNQYDIVSTKVKRILAVVSGASFGVYLIHQLVLDFVKSTFLIVLQQYHVEFLLTLIVFLISMFLVLLFQRIPLLKYLVP